MEKKKIFVVNPGSTSTKVAYFEEETCVFSADVFHDSAMLKTFKTFNDQLPYRMGVIAEFLKEKNIDLSGLDAVVGRGGSCVSVESGIYRINDKLIEDTRNAVSGTWHSSMLGVQLAKEIQSLYGGEMYMLDPIVVDEYQDEARITGIKGIWRRAVCHALNQKAIARKYAEDCGKNYEDLNLIVAHIDGGVTICAHRKGRMIDGNDGGGGDGPFTPTRMGTMAITDFLNKMMDKPKEEIRSLCSQTGGFSSWFGTSNSDHIHKLYEQGDEKAVLVWNAWKYQITKSIGAMAVVLHGKVDGIVLTGGLMRFADVRETIEDACGWIAPVAVYPGEAEMEAMASGALRVLRGEETAKEYTGIPVWDGFKGID
ncbi:MAG: butyrate kinase [Solobacterium sp.]|nr:butyrate kinase [Solobacterium sp.]